MIFASVTFGAIVGYIAIAVALVACLVFFVAALVSGEPLVAAGSILAAVVAAGLWWWGMAFTTSSDYHAWNLKNGQVERVAKRLVATDNGMADRYVVIVGGQPYGVDDTRAALVREGDQISLRCKKDYQWGIPRSAHGWVCRWNGTAE